MSEYVVGYRSDDGSVELRHLNGVPWWEAAVPSRWHRCRPQTTGWISRDNIERCACGAIRFVGTRRWMGRNSRKKNR